MSTTAHMFPRAPEPPGDIVPVLEDIGRELRDAVKRGDSRLCYHVQSLGMRGALRDAINDHTDTHGWIASAPINHPHALRIRAAWEGR